MKAVLKIAAVLYLVLSNATASERFRPEIEKAARDSALLAEELADMLDRLERDDDDDFSIDFDLDDESDEKFDRKRISNIELELEKALADTEKLSKSSLRNRKTGKSSSKKTKSSKLPRKPKQKSDDFDLGFVDSLLDVLDIDNNDEAVDVEAKSEDLVSLEDVDETPKSQGGYQAPSKPDYKENETCEEGIAENKIKICQPDYEVRPQKLYFKAQEVYNEKYCYSKTLTECKEKSSPVTRKVCTQKYSQKEHNVPATNVEVSFERHSEKMGITNCKHVKNGYGDLEEVCYIEEISFHYKLPVVAEEVLELITVEYPEPLEECIDVEIAEIDTKCDHDDDEYCVECAHIRDSKEDVTADKIYPSRYGKCDERTLTLPQSRCVIEQHIKTAAPHSGYGSQASGYGSQTRVPRGQVYNNPNYSAFTAFQ